MTHTIRLRKPWTRQRADQVVEARIDVPDRSSSDELVAAGGLTTYRRKFNQPSGLGRNDRVRLTVAGWRGSLESVAINGVELAGDRVPIGPESAPLNVPIEAWLRPHNELCLVLGDVESGIASLDGEVALEIDAAE